MTSGVTFRRIRGKIVPIRASAKAASAPSPISKAVKNTLVNTNWEKVHNVASLSLGVAGIAGLVGLRVAGRSYKRLSSKQKDNLGYLKDFSAGLVLSGASAFIYRGLAK